MQRTGFVALGLQWDLGWTGKVHPENFAPQVVEVHVIDSILCVRGGRKGYETISLVLLL